MTPPAYPPLGEALNETVTFRVLPDPKQKRVKYEKLRPDLDKADWPCKIPGCQEKRYVQPGGRVTAMCKEHLRQYQNKWIAENGRKSRAKLRGVCA